MSVKKKKRGRPFKKQSEKRVHLHCMVDPDVRRNIHEWAKEKKIPIGRLIDRVFETKPFILKDFETTISLNEDFFNE